MQMLLRDLDHAERQLTAAGHRQSMLERSALDAQAEGDDMRVQLVNAEEYSRCQVRSEGMQG